MKRLRETIEEALLTAFCAAMIPKSGHHNYPIVGPSAATDIALNAVMSALERRAREVGSEEIAERAMNLIRDFGKDQIQPWDTITKIIHSSIAEALALHDAAPERVAERKALAYFRKNSMQARRWIPEIEEILNLASSPVAAKEGEASSPVGWGNEKEYPTEKVNEP